eukprot:CAMPEP_0115480278 /NCGR_PEP_ID=MMETSP0271-20121206/57184_1 /TAXON_ID=71861 /ORGANISM="Scrippsiella trochoidea, Strain CCMP3099" /LENGTH=80 /DNA_ID=CAMNT_0002907945 /DNA_START=72 /DNA_END=314 /DNA_ORIENTATION=-
MADGWWRIQMLDIDHGLIHKSHALQTVHFKRSSPGRTSAAGFTESTTPWRCTRTGWSAVIVIEEPSDNASLTHSAGSSPL